MIDLHTHSTASDASFSPADLIALAKRKNLKAIALTDHDTTDGLAEAREAAAKYNIEFIPGIELSARFNGELHIVGIYIDEKNEKLNASMDFLNSARNERNKNIIKLLQDEGLSITFEEAEKLSGGGMMGRTHIAQILTNKGYTLSVKEAFKKYLSPGKIGFCDYERLSPKECIELIKAAGGIAVLAHCHYLKMDNDELTEFIKNLKNYGLDGIETYYSEYTFKNHSDYTKIAHKLDLLESGGSDFHGMYKPHIELGSGMGNLLVPYSILEKIKQKV